MSFEVLSTRGLWFRGLLDGRRDHARAFGAAAPDSVIGARSLAVAPQGAAIPKGGCRKCVASPLYSGR
jgi:hypothetical protein